MPIALHSFVDGVDLLVIAHASDPLVTMRHKVANSFFGATAVLHKYGVRIEARQRTVKSDDWKVRTLQVAESF